MPNPGNMSRAADTKLDAGCVIFGGFEGIELPDDYARRIRECRLGGVILFKRNLRDAPGAWSLCRQLHAAAVGQLPLLVQVDQEGGRVARLGPPVPQLPPMRVLGRLDDLALTFDAGRVLGRALAAIGFNVDFAPDADVDSNLDNPIIGDRSFSADASTVSRHVVALVQGLQRSGVAACAKHFPGHGDTAQDSHLELPHVRHPTERIDAIELPPFRAAVRAGVASIMTAHVVFDALVPGTPATLAPEILQGLLRDRIGFRGVCVSDDLHMKAVAAHHAIEDAAVGAIRAGCDALLVCTDPASQDRTYDSLVRAADHDPTFAVRLHEAADRVREMRRAYPAQSAPDADALERALTDRDAARVIREIGERAQQLSRR